MIRPEPLRKRPEKPLKKKVDKKEPEKKEEEKKEEEKKEEEKKQEEKEGEAEKKSEEKKEDAVKEGEEKKEEKREEEEATEPEAEEFDYPTINERLTINNSRRGVSSIVIRDSIRPDHGVYMVKVENDHGIASATCEVNVLGENFFLFFMLKKIVSRLGFSFQSLMQSRWICSLFSSEDVAVLQVCFLFFKDCLVA